jgi:hypothetical protein
MRPDIIRARYYRKYELAARHSRASLGKILAVAGDGNVRNIKRETLKAVIYQIHKIRNLSPILTRIGIKGDFLTINHTTPSKMNYFSVKGAAPEQRVISRL